MDHRQSGAAHVNIFFFLIVLVLFLGALGFGYVTLNKNNELESQIAQLRQAEQQMVGKNRLVQHYIEDIAAVVKIPGTYSGRPGIPPEDYSNLTLEGAVEPTALKQKLDAFADAAGISRMNSLDALMGEVVARIQALEQQVADANQERQAALDQKATIDASFADAQRQHSDAVQNLSDNLNTARQDFTAQLNDKDNLLDTTRQNLRDKNDELSQLREDFAAERRGLQEEIFKLQGHNTALVNKISLINPPSQADGKVIAARNNVDRAWINLGKKDMLQPGTIFRIKNPGSDRVKAYATVLRVDQERAEIAISGIVDPVGDQVREGDELYNDIYSPNIKRNIYLLGRFSYPHNKPDLKALLERLGNKVYDKMVPGVDLVILGDDILTEESDGFVPVTDTDEYKEALNLGVEFAPIHKIRDLIKL